MASNLPPRTTTRLNPDDPSVGNLNLDPLTDEPGSHPVGTGVGAAGGAVAGAAIGAVAGPVGAAAGAVVGAIAGGFAGHAAGEAVNPTVEDAYWRTAYVDAPYYTEGRSYEDYAPAYRLGYTSRPRYEGAFDEHEPVLAREWDTSRGASRLTWDEAKVATRAAWDRIDVESPRGGSFDHS